MRIKNIEKSQEFGLKHDKLVLIFGLNYSIFPKPKLRSIKKYDKTRIFDI